MWLDNEPTTEAEEIVECFKGQTVYNGVSVTSVCERDSVSYDNDWMTESTIYVFSDGSELCVQGSTCEVVGE